MEVDALQRQLHGSVARLAAPDTLLMWEARDVYTAGRRTKPEDIPDPTVPVIPMDRGGSVTYHGPGQLVGYPIVTLTRAIGPLEYVRRLEQAVIEVLEPLGVHGTRVDGRTGVWLPADAGRPERKICAIGIRVARMTTMHGFALHGTSASCGPVGNIVPCVIDDAGVTSIVDELGGPPPSLIDLATPLEPLLAQHLGFALTPRP